MADPAQDAIACVPHLGKRPRKLLSPTIRKKDEDVVAKSQRVAELKEIINARRRRLSARDGSFQT
jgi:hypothetical protein